MTGQVGADAHVQVSVAIEVAGLGDGYTEAPQLTRDVGGTDALTVTLIQTSGTTAEDVDGAPQVVLVGRANREIRVAVVVQVAEAGQSRTEATARCVALDALDLDVRGSLRVLRGIDNYSYRS